MVRPNERRGLLGWPCLGDRLVGAVADAGEGEGAAQLHQDAAHAVEELLPDELLAEVAAGDHGPHRVATWGQRAGMGVGVGGYNPPSGTPGEDSRRGE